ncbi:hypothetical protein DIURU_001638 [Diutina rugosa]|uniref:1-phosphatidylinositol 4-kinase n=1 Tax=Diutina rugosa TaxID=5481 RepID=A0A642UVK7_DIURU|nr:uncharacterized protein DIURU_001638 [Diutina rugosa]KAA8905210.1 hypothetical protein DIURU_001638 [Diutina rugosa]
MDYEKVLAALKGPRLSSLECIDYLRRYGDNVGVHHAVVERLRQFSYDELEFYIPQLIQLLVSYETDSMALEDFLLDYCVQYPHFSLLVFWNLQAFVWELRNDPESYSFQTVRKFINQLQNILFTTEGLPQQEFKENLQPALVLCGAIAASVAMPGLGNYINPIIRSQSRQQKSFVFKLANFQKALTRNLTLKNQGRVETDPQLSAKPEKVAPSGVPLKRSVSLSRLSHLESDSEVTTDDEPESKGLRAELSQAEGARLHRNAYNSLEENLKINTVIKSKKKRAQPDRLNHSSRSLPDLSPEAVPEAALTRSLSQTIRPKQPTYDELVRTLRVNYARQACDFAMSLQNISLRLSSVPKEARLSALRAELSIINNKMLPAEVDIPQLLPITSNRNKKYHKILRLTVNEACVLNSAERVPFLLLVEYLSDEIDFNPFSEYNSRIIGHGPAPAAAVPPSAPGSPLTVASATSGGTGVDEISTMIDETDLSDLPRTPRLPQTPQVSSPLADATPVTSATSANTDTVSTSAPPGDRKHLADQMRIASVMLQQLESSGQSSSEHSAAIRGRIVQSMIALQDQFDSIDYNKINELTGDAHAGERKMENDAKVGEDWARKRARIKSQSPYGHLPNWELCSVIAKNGDDLPQEAFACQLITLISNIWRHDRVGAWTKRMKIVITSATTGLVETIINAMSIHSIKKSMTEASIASGENSRGRIATLSDYFVQEFGDPSSRRHRNARANFAKSLASYSIICYVLQIKDRHNGNIMVDADGHIIHIDFGFLLSNSPGSVGFEAAPFKLTQEYVDVMGGVDSPDYADFRRLCKICFLSLRKQGQQVVSMVELMQRDSTLPCFNNGDNTSVLLAQRLQMDLSDADAESFVDGLITKSLGSMYTRVYDQFQMITQGIYY